LLLSFQIYAQTQLVYRDIRLRRMKTFIINLPEAKLRRRSVINEAKKAGLDFELIDAVNGSELSEEDIDKLCDRDAITRSPKWLTRGAIGCSLSHLEIYGRIISENLPYALVLEDDVELKDGFSLILDRISSKVNQDRVIMLYYQSWEPLQLSIFGKEELKIKDYALYRPYNIKQVITTGAYIIGRGAAERLYKSILPIRFSADSWGHFYQNGMLKDLVCLYPRIVEIKPFKSSIDYIENRYLSELLKWIDRIQVPIISKVLEKRRKKWQNERQKIIVLDEVPVWKTA